MGIPLMGITDINYEEKQDMDNIYGAGNRPVSRGYGRITYEGNLTIAMEELESYKKASPTGRLQDIPEFPIVISFLPDSGTIVTHKIKYVRFKNNGRKIKEGDMKIEHQIDLVIGDIDWGT
jgi:hypothetical protein